MMLLVLFVMLLCHLSTGGNCSFDSHYVIHKDKTFLQTDGGPAVNGTLFVCGWKGSDLPPNGLGSWYVAYVVPALEIVSEEHLKGNATIRSKRDLFYQNFQVATSRSEIIFCYHSTRCHSCLW